MKKIIGLVLIVVGFILLLANFSFIGENLSKFIPFIKIFPKNYILGAGVVLVLLGLFFMKKNNIPGKNSLVPIFEGKKIIGYQKRK